MQFLNIIPYVTFFVVSRSNPISKKEANFNLLSKKVWPYKKPVKQNLLFEILIIFFN